MRMTRRSAAPPATGRSASAGQTAGRGSEAAALQSQLGWQAGSPAQGTDSGQAARTNRQETAGQTERMTEGLAHTLGEDRAADRAGHVWEEAGLPEVGDFSDQPALPLTSPERPEPAADDIPHAPDELNEPDNPWVDEVPLPESFADQPAASLYPRTLSGHSAGQGPDSPATAGAAGSPAMPAAEFPEESGFAREEQLFSLPRETVRLSAQVRAPRLRSDSPSAELSGQSLEVVRTMQGLRERLAGRRRSTLFAADQDETATADGGMPDMAAAPAFGGTGSGGSGSGGTLSGDTLADGPAAPADSLWSGGAGSEDRAQAAPWQEEHLAGAGTFAGSAQAAMDTAGDSAVDSAGEGSGAVSARVREEEQTDRPAPVRRRLMTVVTVLGLAMLLLAGGLWYLLAHAPAEPALSRLQQRAAGTGHVPADSHAFHAGDQAERRTGVQAGGISSGGSAGSAASAAGGRAGSGEALTAEELAAAAALGLAPASDAPAAAGEEGILEVTLDSPQDSPQNAAQTVPHDSGSLPADSTAGAAPAASSASSASSAPAASDASGQDTAGAALPVTVPEPVRAALAAAAASGVPAQLQASDAQHGRSAAEGTLSALHSELAAMTRTLGELGTALGGVDRRTSAVLSRLDGLASSVQSLHTALQAEEKAAATAHTQTAGKQVAEKQKTKAAAAQAKAGSKPDRKHDRKIDRTRDRKSAAHGSVQSTQTQDRQKARTVAARRGSGAARSQEPAGWSVQGLHENMAILRDASGRDWQVREGSRAGSLEVTDIDLARGRVVTTQGTLTWRP